MPCGAEFWSHPGLKGVATVCGCLESSHENWSGGSTWPRSMTVCIGYASASPSVSALPTRTVHWPASTHTMPNHGSSKVKPVKSREGEGPRKCSAGSDAHVSSGTGAEGSTPVKPSPEMQLVTVFTSGIHGFPLFSRTGFPLQIGYFGHQKVISKSSKSHP